jgi:VWFA-related protein
VSPIFPRFFLLILTLCIVALAAAAQEQPRAPEGESQDELRVTVEEVRIPVAAYDAGGRFDATLGAEDLLVREDGVAQQVRGVYRVPADVLLVLDTGGERNPAKRVRLTREAAVHFVGALRPEDRLAAWQVSGRVEPLSDWTTDRAAVVKSLRTRLLPGRRSVLAEAMAAAFTHLRQTPAGNRHLVLVSDGVDYAGGGLALTEAFRRLSGSGVTVHVISYTSLGRAAPGPRVVRKRERGPLPDEGVMALPRTKRRENTAPDLRDINEAEGGGVIDLDRLFGGDGRPPREELERREAEFAELTAETGGTLSLPLTAQEMVEQAAAVAREIDARYVVTYRPFRPVGEARPGEYRRLDVLPRRLGLTLRTRRGYFVKRR